MCDCCLLFVDIVCWLFDVRSLMVIVCSVLYSVCLSLVVGCCWVFTYYWLPFAGCLLFTVVRCLFVCVGCLVVGCWLLAC